MRPSAAENSRLHNLDYLRGIAAFGIMIYHYLTWWGGSEFTADTFLARVGVYGVSIFYVLSGLTLYHVYFKKMTDIGGVRDFAVKRVFRIFPLLWLVTILAIVMSRKLPNLLDLFLNLTGLFGFVKWGTYFSAGVWSIGNELVFYVIFPLLVLCARSQRSLLTLAGAALLAPYLYFAFIGLTPNQSLAEQWISYISPFNQAFLFFCGFAIGHILRSRSLPQPWLWGTLIAALAAFTLIPAVGAPVVLVTGLNRLAFTLICVLICAAAYRIRVRVPRAVHIPLGTLGEASYSVYLIHPLTYLVVHALLRDRVAPVAQVLIAITITLVLSWLCYRRFEKYFMGVGRRVAGSLSRAQARDAS